jgi:hypothetical protein
MNEDFTVFDTLLAYRCDIILLRFAMFQPRQVKKGAGKEKVLLCLTTFDMKVNLAWSLVE